MVHDLSKPNDAPEDAPFNQPQDVAIRQAVDRHGKLCLELQFIDPGNFVFAKIVPAQAAVDMGEYIAEVARACLAGIQIAKEQPAQAPPSL